VTPSLLFRPVAIAGLAVLVAVLVGLMPPIRRLELWAADRQAAQLTPAQPYDGALLVAIDEDSLEKLRPIAGSWPFKRQLLARVTEYLSNAGARSIAYDILLSDERPGDASFAAALAVSRSPVTLAAVATPYELGRVSDRTRTSPVAWPGRADELPAQSWTDIRLPRPELGATRVGVTNLVPDEDGVVRRVPLLHRVGSDVLPSLALSAMFPGQRPELSVRGGRLTVGHRTWPVDGHGQVTIVLPSRPHPIAQVPFSRIVTAAQGQNDPELGELVAGRTVFVGVTALLLAEPHAMPFGRAASLVLVAQSYAALDRGAVLESPSWILSGLVLLLALAVPVTARLVRPNSLTLLVLATLAGLGLAWAVSAALLAWWRQPTPIVLVRVAGICAFILFLADKIHALRVARQRLTTERMAAERAAALKSEFLAHVSHELRTPLTAIIGFSGTLADERSLAPDKRAIVQIVRRNGEQLLWLVNNLLDQARIAAGQMTIEARVTSVAEILDQAMATLSGVPRRAGVELRPAIVEAGVPSHMWIDGQRMRQIVINLGANALKFTEHGHVQTSMAWRDGWLDVSVADTGPGIPADALKRVFEAFQQVDEGAARKGGTGLGLTISRNLAHLMGGELTLESTMGVGSTFRVRVPARRAEAESAAHAVGPSAVLQRPGPSPTAPAAAKALVADDSEDIRTFLQLCLKRVGLDVTLVEDGRTAVATALAERPALVLIDVQMPEMSGPEAVQAMRRAGLTSVIVAMTAGSGDALESELLASGCNAVVFKPMTADFLMGTVTRLLERGAADAAVVAKATGA
jgi:signal transduction histidine kinase/ActR/RegA family two-component response regulator